MVNLWWYLLENWKTVLAVRRRSCGVGVGTKIDCPGFISRSGSRGSRPVRLLIFAEWDSVGHYALVEIILRTEVEKITPMG